MSQDETMRADDIRALRDLIDAYADNEQYEAWTRLQQRICATPSTQDDVGGEGGA